VTPGPARRVLVALAVVLSVAFALAAHAALVRGLPPGVGALLSLVPLSFLMLWAIRRTRHRIMALALLAAVVVACVLEWPVLERNFPNVFFLEHAGGNLLLALLFGRTLARGREPLVTTFARIAHDGITPALARYTRQVTLAWTLFFLALFTASSVLYLGGHTAAWSTLANLLSPLLVGAMFVVEYVVRHRVLPDLERIGILGGARAFSRHFAAARLEAPR
jgi:uncharacterized membrane protein